MDDGLEDMATWMQRQKSQARIDATGNLTQLESYRSRLQVIHDDLEHGEPLVKVNSIADSVLQHTSSHGQSAIRHDINNASLELDMTKTEVKQKLTTLDDLISKLKVSLALHRGRESGLLVVRKDENFIHVCFRIVMFITLKYLRLLSVLKNSSIYTKPHLPKKISMML